MIDIYNYMFMFYEDKIAFTIVFISFWTSINQSIYLYSIYIRFTVYYYLKYNKLR